MIQILHLSKPGFNTIESAFCLFVFSILFISCMEGILCFNKRQKTLIKKTEDYILNKEKDCELYYEDYKFY